MKNEIFNTEIKMLLIKMLKEDNITMNYFEEKHDLYSDTFNISITCLHKEEGISKDE